MAEMDEDFIQALEGQIKEWQEHVLPFFYYAVMILSSVTISGLRPNIT